MDTQPIPASPAEETPELEASHIDPAAPEDGAAPSPETPEEPKWRFRLPQWIRQRVTAARAAFLLGPWLSYIMVEVLNNNNPFTAHSTEQDLLNLIWYYLIFWLFRMLLGRKVLAGGVSAVACFLFGLANHYVLSFRGRIIFPCDLLTLDTAAVVAKSYDYTPDKQIWIALAVLGGYLLLLLLAHIVYHPKGRQRLGRKLLWGSIAGMVIYLFAFFFTPLLPTIGIYTQQWRTQQNGFLLNFTTAIRYSFVSEPDGYDADKVAQTARSYRSQSVTDAGDLPENLIFIMNESFSDLTAAFPNLELSEDPLAFYHSLTENTVKGTMISPVTGGGTANVEFEYLTGDSLAFLPSSTVAYQLYLYDGCPSLVSQAKDLGYHTIAFHPYLSSGWNRTSVYPWLGFDEVHFQEDVRDPQYIRNYVSDLSDYEQLFRWTEENDGPTMIFNVTMQNHSGYSQGWNNLSGDVNVTGGAKSSSITTQYFSLMKESDQAIQALVEHYSQVEEKTMIVFFGDHQPPLGNTFFETLYGKKLDERDPEEVQQAYETPFFIWANYDIPERDDLRISSNYLGVLAAEVAGLPLTGYQQLLSRLMDVLPVASTAGYVTADGQVTQEVEELPGYVQSLYREYELAAYNHLFDEKHHPEDFFSLRK
ncbi:MAG: LTA synthase family protein [Dysosmobacter sp.]|nr:LTA synthase family protein [Dysosmobacter sp.]